MKWRELNFGEFEYCNGFGVGILATFLMHWIVQSSFWVELVAVIVGFVLFVLLMKFGVIKFVVW